MNMTRPRKLLWLRPTRRVFAFILRCGTALWLVFYLLYVPFHLHSESHLEGSSTNPGVAAPHLLLAYSAEPDHDHHHHTPHLAVQHQLKFAQSDRVVFHITWYFEAPPGLSLEPQWIAEPVVFERLRPPGTTPPPPARPRAPPAA